MFSYYVYEKPGKESYGTVERYHTGKGIGILLAEILLLIFNLLFFGTDTGSRKKGYIKKLVGIKDGILNGIVLFLYPRRQSFC